MRIRPAARSLALAGLMGAIAPAAHADLILTYALPDGSPMVQEISEHGVRADIQGGTSYYIPGRGVFLAVQMQGAQRVFAFDQFMSMMQGMAGNAGGEEAAPVDVDIVDTGRTETVAGIEGSVYEVVGPNGDSAEIVASNDVGQADLYNDMMGAYLGGLGDGLAAMAGSDPAAGFQMFQEEPLGIILRAEDGMRLVSVQETDIDPARFELPAEPSDLSEMFQQ